MITTARLMLGTKIHHQPAYKSDAPESFVENPFCAMSSPLDTFDPFAVHPFTNNCGVLPPSPQPSRYPSAVRRYPVSSISPTPNPTLPPSQQYSFPPQAASPARPIFVPFRRETASPDLVLKKKPMSMSPEAGSGTKRP